MQWLRKKVAEYWQMVKSVTLRGRSFSKEAHPSSLYQIWFIAKNYQVESRKAAKFWKPAAMTSSLNARCATRKVWQQLFSVVTAFQLRMVGNVLFWQLQPVQNKPILSAMRPFQTHIWSVSYLALPDEETPAIPPTERSMVFP